MIKKIVNIRLKAGALQYTIFIAVVIALMLFAFISLSFTQQHFSQKATAFVETVNNTNLAIDYALKNELPYNSTIIEESPNSKTTVLKSSWGVFELIESISIINKETFTTIALLGGNVLERPALYLEDNNQPLVVVGQTNIVGKSFLPKQAVKRGTIAGNTYTGSQLIYGTIELSKNTLPNLENRKNIQALCNGSYQFQESTLIDLQEYATMTNSFENPTQIFKSNLPIDLKNINLTGNIVIQSNTLIRIHASATLKDIILIAPYIEILDHVEGNFQAFASKEILVGKSCKLSYPSALVIYESKEGKQQIYNSTDNQNLNQLIITENSEIKGIVSFLSDNESNNYKPQLSISESSVVIGEVFCDRNLQLMGTVKGSVYTKNFITLAYGSVYQNHLYNGKILSLELAEQYSGLMLETDIKGVAKWLY